MQTFDFVLNVRHDGSRDLDDVVDDLYEGGCDDSIIGSGIPGVLSLRFARQASSKEEAISSAWANVRAVLPNAIEYQG
ncbi:DNA-binding protein [Cupriavidus sp. HMR-1]|uniref:hypothetical protein n=1 Tax=Burkholderiaceae TaxID=119060 RepID=UPI0002A35440|nr:MULTISPECIES: hypothetical protein [Burkholderiaceae]ELA00801.1 DNA-binding protein [Cupriavidus sp. HMR-1]KVS16437.1 hypothetical protein WK32_27115 [Burkholderia vietnamiensis]